MTTKVESITDWLALPEIAIPVLSSPSDSGTTHIVHKIGFLAVGIDECKREGLQAMSGPGGKCLLPTSVIEFAGSKKLCRLPLELADWAFQSVSAVHAGQFRMPATVEFGSLQGRKYAEYV